MVDAVLSRGATSVSIPILGEGGDLAIARDVGKPTAEEYPVGQTSPHVEDNKNASDAWTVTGLLEGPTAYADARTIAEDIIKPRVESGTPIQLDLSALPNRGTYKVAAHTASAATLTYTPGRRQLVGVQLSLSVISDAFGGTQPSVADQSPDAGDGIKLDRNGTSVTLAVDQTLTRKVGRPESQLHEQPADLPRLIDKNAPASDIFELDGALVDGNATANAQTLEETIVRGRLGDDPLTLHFLDNLYGLGAYNVVPNGSQALRTTTDVGETGVVRVPKLALKTVSNT